MKRVFYLLWALVLWTCLLVGCGKKPSTDEEDGGVRHYVDTDAPKSIRSNQIVSFSCKFSTLNLSETDSPLAGGIYQLRAEETIGSIEARNRGDVYENKTFTPTPAFFAELQSIVLAYDFARYNGQFYTVSGLPPDYGAQITVLYASGERISSSNNQSCFLPVEAMEALLELFREA